MKELNLNEMEQVSGGVLRTIDTGVEGLNAKLRNGPSMKGTKQIASLPNGTLVDTLTGIRTEFCRGDRERADWMDRSIHCRTAAVK